MNLYFKWLLGVLIWLIGAGVGWFTGREPLQVQLAQQASAHAIEQAQLAQHAAAVLQAAQARGDALSQGLQQQQSQINQLKQERRDALKQATTGQPCLNGPALRLLNHAPGLDIRDLSPTTGGAVAADERVATDTDIALWITDTGAAFEVCRARLDALIDWHLHP